ncbi:hypothetical protein EI020_20615 [Escherichia coli]|nr:hypothetical protein [Escherichia coli]
MLTRSRGFNGSIQCQNIRLESNTVDDGGDLRNFLRTRGDRGARRIRKKSYAKVFRASVRAETSRLPVCGSAARRNRRLG